MKRLRFKTLAALAVAACGANPVEFDSFRQVRVGMTVPEAAAAFGTSLEPVSPLDEDELFCHYVFPNGTAGPIGFMIVDGHVVRIDIDAPGSRTEAGVGVGSTESEVLAAYQGQAAVEPHPYTSPEGHYIVVAQQNERGAIFETDGTRVLRFRVGRDDAVR